MRSKLEQRYILEPLIKYLQKQLLEILRMKLELGIDRSAVGKEEEGTQRNTQKYKEHFFSTYSSIDEPKTTG